MKVYVVTNITDETGEEESIQIFTTEETAIKVCDNLNKAFARLDDDWSDYNYYEVIAVELKEIPDEKDTAPYLKPDIETNKDNYKTFVDVYTE